MAIRPRPLSPHLQVYRWQIQMVTSILHRVTGVFLSAGALVIAAGLLMLMLGADSWSRFSAVAGAWYGQAFLLVWTWCFAYHLLNGIRHLLQDFGYAYKIPDFVRNSWLSVIGSVVLTVLVWAYVLMGKGA